MSQGSKIVQEKGRQIWQVDQSEEGMVAPGVKYACHQISNGDMKEAVYLVEVDTSHEWVQMEPVSAQGKAVRLDTVGNMLHELEEQGKSCVAGFNGDFFSYAGVPSGLQLVEGEIITAPLLTKVMLAIMQDGSVKLEDSVVMNGLLHCENGYIMQIDGINRARKPSETDHACVYTWRYGDSTRTPEGGIEVIVAASEAEVRLHQGRPLQGIVQSIHKASDSLIERGTWVLAITGSKAAQFQEQVAIGAKISLQVEFDKGIRQARHVISGNSTLAFMLLKNGEIPAYLQDPKVRLNSDRHPRTIAAIKQGKLYFTAVDGRQSGHSDGMTLAEAASYLQSLGMEDAMNLDGGGSTTCYIRRPGDRKAMLINRPSDGFEREIGNAWAIMTKAPSCELDTLVVTPSAVRAIAGSKVTFQVKGHDRYWNAAEINPEHIQWSVVGDIGVMNDEGEWTACSHIASGQIVVRYGEVVQAVQVSVTNQLARLVLNPSSVEIEPGGSYRFHAQAFDEQGNELQVSNDRLTWSMEGSIGSWIEPGILAAAADCVKGKVRASHGPVNAYVNVHVGKPHFIIADFESLDGLEVDKDNTRVRTIMLNKAARPSPVRFGTFSGKWTYDFTGSSTCHITFKNEHGAAGRVIEGSPYRFGLWVHGDEAGHRLRLVIEDADGFRQSLDLTESESGGLHWKGWKYVYTDVPPNTRLPIRVHTLTLAESSFANKNKGVIYLDQFRAEYVDFQEDLEGPEFSGLEPADQAEITDTQPIIQVTVTDEKSGVDPSSLRVWLNDAVLPHVYCSATGRMQCIPQDHLQAGTYRVKVEAADRERNAALPAATWMFTVIN